MEENRDKKYNQQKNHTHNKMMLLLQCSDDVFTSVDLKYGCIGIISKQQLYRRLAKNKQNKITTEMLIVNMQSGDQMEPTLCCCCCCFWCSCFCALAATIDDSDGEKYH